MTDEIKTEPVEGPSTWFANQRSDKEKGLHHHDMNESGASKNFDQKVYYFPESYNQLRSELYHYYPALWQVVGWPMAYAANIFVEQMNQALDLTVVLDSDRVDAICTEYLAALRKKRGISSH